MTYNNLGLLTLGSIETTCTFRCVCVCVCVCVCLCVCVWEGRGFQCEENMRLSSKRAFCLKRKITCEEAFQDLLKSCISFGGGLEGSIKEKMGRQQKEEFL